MTGFPEKLRLKEMAEEDIYFAKRDRELIEALRQKRLKEHVRCPSEDNRDRAKAYEKKFRKITQPAVSEFGASPSFPAPLIGFPFQRAVAAAPA